jgi:hypothetical protein
VKEFFKESLACLDSSHDEKVFEISAEFDLNAVMKETLK